MKQKGGENVSVGIMQKIINQLILTARKLRRKSQAIADLNLYRELYPAESIDQHRFYNIGAGDFSHPAWTNVDGGAEFLESYHENGSHHIHHDLFDHLPLPAGDGKAEIVYTSHTIEHIDDPSVEFLFRDVYRILKPGGIFRIVTPDTELAYKAWKRNDRRFYFWLYDDDFLAQMGDHCLSVSYKDATLTQVFLEEFAAQASAITNEGADKRISDEELIELFNTRPFEEVLNYCTSLCSVEMQKKYPGRHMNWFHEGKLKRQLRQAGFSQVERSAYLQSSSPVLRNPLFFDQTLPMHSIYMEAVK
jgi:predicted SAM-dependent methyltransferase